MPLNTSPGPSPSFSDDPANLGLSAVLCAFDEFSPWDIQLVRELEGGASTRQFFRIRMGDQNAVAMYTPAPSQEIAKARQSSGYEPFVEVAELLSSHGISVPKIIAAAKSAPVLLVEDLGDYTLASYLQKHPETREALYKKAVLTLAQAQGQLNPLPPTSVIRRRAFDYDLLLWEVEHFRDWALSARGVVLTDEDSTTFSRSAKYLAHTISSWERGFVHRDYQSRNIMVRGPLHAEHLTWIDFQDAMLGPRVYDLVALLTDSYQSFTPDFVARRLDEYCDLRNCTNERQLIGQEFSLVTVQRKLKDAGRFIFLQHVNKNPHFLQFVEPTIEKARRALRQVRDMGPLSELDDMLERLFGPLPDA